MLRRQTRDEEETTKPVLAGVLAAAAIILAFVAGMMIEVENDGPVEEIGEAIEEATPDQG